ncbi:MAG: sigma-70 family RNA polymerase sigma factor [Phycisphaerae bacterium]|jgi:RNA polymerase sigma factor (TIGR02999 family)
MNEQNSQVTSLLSALGNGDAGAAERLMRTVYDELHRIAHARMRNERRTSDLQTTVLVQEAYLRLLGGNGATVPANRRHFFAAAAKAMRQFLVDDARRRDRQKRGGGRPAGELNAMASAAASLDRPPAEVLALNDALEKLRLRDARKAQIVELRYFTGLSVDETANVLGVSARQVDKEWSFAKAWLHRELS